MLLYYKHVECRASIQKQVVCEHCDGAFQYTLARGAAMDVMPPLTFLVKQAEATCRKRVAKKLEGVDPVSCPACGWLQTDMAMELRFRFLKKMRTAGIMFICACLGILPLMGMVAVTMKLGHYSVGDINGVGLTLALLTGVPVGMLMIYVRFLLAKLRYPATAFKPRRPTRARGNNVSAIPAVA